MNSYSWLVVIAATAGLWIRGGDGGTFTSGFPSLDEIRGNGSLLSDGVYSTHDGEIRSVPVRSNCTSEMMWITAITFIALPGVGGENSTLVVMRQDNSSHSVNLSSATATFGDFGYELSLQGNDGVPFEDGDTLEIHHQSYANSSLRILYQVGLEVDDMLPFCWRELTENADQEHCLSGYDYPLLAFETMPPGCINGFLTVTELRSMWENRTRPVLYSSPDREITLDCSVPGILSRILVGAYITGSGDEGPAVEIDDNPLYDLSTLHATEYLNVYECVLDSPVEIEGSNSVHIVQRYTTSQISFLHDGQTDTPLISVTTSGECSSSQFLSEDDLREKAALHIPNFVEVEDDYIFFPHLNITQDGYLVKWIFTAEDLGQGQRRTEYPELEIARGFGFQTRALEGSGPLPTDYSDVYEFTLASPIQVQAGDSVALELPPITSARLLLSFVRNSGPPGESVRVKRDIQPVEGREGDLPLVTLEISPLLMTDMPLPSSTQFLSSLVSRTAPPPSVSTSLMPSPSTSPEPDLPPTHLPLTTHPPPPTSPEPDLPPTHLPLTTHPPPPTSPEPDLPPTHLPLTTHPPPSTSPEPDLPSTSLPLTIHPPPSTSSKPDLPPTHLLLTTHPPPSTYLPSPTQPPPSTPQSTPRSTPTDDSGRESSSNSSGAIVGAVVGLLLAAGLVLALILVLLFVLHRRKMYRVKEKESDNANLTAPMDNPVYTGCDSGPARLIEEPEYQVPSPPPTSTTPPTATALLTGAATTNATDSSRVYEVLDEVPEASKEDRRKSFDNPAYYSTLQDVHSTTDTHKGPVPPSPNHYEMGIYVPTQEQRKHVETCAFENVYATLEETQVGKTGKTVSFFEECDTYWRPASTTEDLYQQLAQRKYREIPRHQIQITEHLGSGQFGTVNRGVWQGGGQAGVEVAVKMLQEGTSELDTVRFLQEAAINGQFRHPNIVQLLGVVTVGKPVMIVLELLNNGDLRNYLLKHKPTPGELLPSDTAALLAQFCVQVARGMDYLSSKAFVHRDLAARNILITEDKACKISDFGMSRDLEEGTYYVSHGGQVPVKWTAPEALHFKKYSTASDVWSFGCLMYEIWSLGHKPFEGYTNQEAIKLVDNGCRLAPPPGCPREMYRLMITCWNSDKSGRPQFREIVQTLSQSEDELLFIPEVTRGHPQASILGAPLEAGRDLYTQLQNTYIH